MNFLLKHKLIFYFGIILSLWMTMTTCTKVDRVNPWDDKATMSPDEWAPKNLSIEDISITEKKLNWSYDDKNIEGFKIERRANSSAWESPFPILSKELRSFNDTTVLPDTTLTYEYRLFAVAGNNQSTEMTKAIKILFPAPTNLSVVANGETTATLAWNDNSNGENGFQIERSNDNKDWDILATVTANSGTFQDSSFPITENVYYRISAFVGDYHSAMEESLISRLPEVVTTSIIDKALTSATSGGNVTLNGGLPITACGVCWSTSQNPTATDSHTTDGSGTGSFTSNITGLTINTLYYVRAYATNSAGTSYGSQVSFTTQSGGSGGTVTDIEGNIYTTVIIGTQEWMAENLKVTHYRNGEPIPNVTDLTQWANLTTGAYCWYNNDEVTNGAVYGALYNWFTVVDSRNLCPTGWHTPSDAEWTILSNYLGGESVAGGKMKETGTIHWQSPNTAATNESGFTGLPGGFRLVYEPFNYIGSFGRWWSSTSNGGSYVWHRDLGYNNGDIYRFYNDERDGFSVRCVKD